MNMSKSEKIGELSNIRIEAINEKLRIIQRLMDGMLETFGSDYLTQFMTIAEHNSLGHALGEVVPHDSILNLTDVSVLNDTLKDNENKIFTIDSAGVHAEALNVFSLIDGSTNQITIINNNDNTITISAPEMTRGYYFGFIQ